MSGSATEERDVIESIVTGVEEELAEGRYPLPAEYHVSRERLGEALTTVLSRTPESDCEACAEQYGSPCAYCRRVSRIQALLDDRTLFECLDETIQALEEAGDAHTVACRVTRGGECDCWQRLRQKYVTPTEESDPAPADRAA